MVFSTALRPFLERRPGTLDFLELEPQTLWLADHAFAGPFHEFTPGIELFQRQQGKKLVHSVGMPLGGTRAPDPAQCALLRSTAERLGSPWVSEHLSVAGTPAQAAGFLLPPLQTDAGVRNAARNVRAFGEAMGRPVAVETGVAYLRRKPFEMPDGTFLAQVVEEGHCGILLDLHNLWCNQRNGRIRIEEFLAQIPLDRVWEVHLAGGEELGGTWLDSHSGVMPDGLSTLAREVVSSLPNLGALTFEIYDTFLRRLEPGVLDGIVDELHEIWSVARRPQCAAPRRPAPFDVSLDAPSPAAWEASLTAAVWKSDPQLHPHSEDAAPLRLYAWLARSFRGSMLARALPRSIRYLILREREDIETLLSAYYTAEPPRLYTPLEAEAFRAWAIEADGDPLLRMLLEFDCAFLRVVREGRPQVVTFPGDPTPVLVALAEARMPSMPEPPTWEMEIVPDAFTTAEFSASAVVG